MRASGRTRLALALGLAVPLLVGPVVADAASGPLACRGASTVGRWQQVPVERFAAVESVQTRDVVTAYAVDARRPARVLATNGNTVKSSASTGCSWEDGLVLGAAPTAAVPFSGTTSTIVSTALLPGGPALAAVREGTGPASRPHVVRSETGARGSWSASDSGLPAQGAPQLVEAATDGRTAYLVLSPASSGGTSGGTLPTLPGAPAQTAPAGLLYATTDGGRTWALRTGAGALGAGGIDALSIDPRDPELLYAVSSGRLLVSTDGGRSLAPTSLGGVTAVEAMEARELVAATADGIVHSTDAGGSFRARAPLSGVRSLAYRTGDDVVVAESQGLLYRVSARGSGRAQLVQAGLEAAPGGAVGDRAANGTFHVLAEHSLLRFVDPVPPGASPPPAVPAERPAPPPPPGRVDPPSRNVTLQVGESQVLDYALVLPPSPTPLDVFFLVDTSLGMGPYIEALKQNFRGIVRSLQAGGVDVKVGLGATGAGPGPGEPPFEEVDPTPERDPYQKPVPYRLLRAVGDVDGQLDEAFTRLRLDSNVQTSQRSDIKEGQLIALEQLLTGKGLEQEGSSELAPRFTVAPGQKAGFRNQEGVRKLVVLATDEEYNAPFGTPMKDGEPDIAFVTDQLRAAGVQVVGLAPDEGGRAAPDLRTTAAQTRALAPAGGVACGGTADPVGAGEPLVCQTPNGFGEALTDLVRGLVDEQDVRLVAQRRSPVLGAVDAVGLRGLDVTLRNEIPFRVRVSCVDVKPGTYAQELDAVLRGFTVATARATVTCTAVPPGAAVAPPRRAVQPQAEDQPPPAQPVSQVPPAPAPAPPVVQPQAQPQPQAQVQSQVQTQPMTAAALQQQEELQLALALLGEERPGTEYAMVDRRREQTGRAHALLAFAVLASSAAGLARLRSSPAVRRSRG